MDVPKSPSLLSADDYIINAGRTSQRLSIGYPIETYLKKFRPQAYPPEADSN